jgi:hypothetical protein
VVWLSQACVDALTYQQATCEGALTAAVHLIMQPSEVWRRGAMLVQVAGRAVLVTDGVPVSLVSVAEVATGAAARAEPAVVIAGGCCVLEACGGGPPAGAGAPEERSVTCRAAGRYFDVQASAIRADSGRVCAF